jgi:hypothetical protein
MGILFVAILGRPNRERGEVNVSMISWMVVVALVIFAFRAQLTNMLLAAVNFVTNTLGI